MTNWSPVCRVELDVSMTPYVYRKLSPSGTTVADSGNSPPWADAPIAAVTAVASPNFQNRSAIPSPSFSGPAGRVRTPGPTALFQAKRLRRTVFERPGRYPNCPVVQGEVSGHDGRHKWRPAAGIGQLAQSGQEKEDGPPSSLPRPPFPAPFRFPVRRGSGILSPFPTLPRPEA